eukprot:gene6574-9039_t
MFKLQLRQVKNIPIAKLLNKFSSFRFASSLIIGEYDHTNSSINSSTIAAITAGSKIGEKVSLLFIGSKLMEVAEKAASIKNVSSVILIEHNSLEVPVGETISDIIVKLAPQFSHIIAATSNFSKNYLPRAAAILDCSPLTDVTNVVAEDTFQRPMYAGNAISTVKMTDAVKFLLVRPTSFEKTTETNATPAPIQNLPFEGTISSLSTFVSESSSKSERPDLSSARVVVSGGRGMKSSEGFKMLDTLADKLGGAVGASRAAVDAGYVPNDYQVGQTGKVVAPDLYIAVGISGAIQHLSGIDYDSLSNEYDIIDVFNNKIE